MVLNPETNVPNTGECRLKLAAAPCPKHAHTPLRLALCVGCDGACCMGAGLAPSTPTRPFMSRWDKCSARRQSGEQASNFSLLVWNTFGTCSTTRSEKMKKWNYTTTRAGQPRLVTQLKWSSTDVYNCALGFGYLAEVRSGACLLSGMEV